MTSYVRKFESVGAPLKAAVKSRQTMTFNSTLCHTVWTAAHCPPTNDETLRSHQGLCEVTRVYVCLFKHSSHYNATKNNYCYFLLAGMLLIWQPHLFIRAISYNAKLSWDYSAMDTHRLGEIPFETATGKVSNDLNLNKLKWLLGFTDQSNFRDTFIWLFFPPTLSPELIAAFCKSTKLWNKTVNIFSIWTILTGISTFLF